MKESVKMLLVGVMFMETFGECLARSHGLRPFQHQWQCVRWRNPPQRKPRWVPVAKSKMFRIPVKPKDPENEALELQRLSCNYNTYMKSLRKYLYDTEVVVRNQKKATEEDFTVQQEELELLLKENEEENKRVAAVRAQRLAREEEEERERVLQSEIQYEREQEEKLAMIEKIVQQEKENLKTSITRENLEQMIEVAMDNLVSYEYALDLEGYIYRGRHTKPVDVPHEKRERLEPASETQSREEQAVLQ